MRLLATHHITKEVRPDIFANNRVSSAMDSGRSIEELMTTWVFNGCFGSSLLIWLYVLPYLA